MNPRGYGIVRADVSPSSVDGYVRDIRALAVERSWDLRAIFVEPSDIWFPLLVTSLGVPGTGVVIVPTPAHLGGWMDVVRRSVEVWTLYPLMRWSRTGDNCE
ncbi:hypothetical protein [Nocardia sp. N2S4-5]|uniref:hypothetical protein n=1 Tax=Nocardia sp. N2S4-5 TaxID=3351565 RepID=UPI0037D73B9D